MSFKADLEKHGRVETLHCSSPVPIPLPQYVLLGILYQF